MPTALTKLGIWNLAIDVIRDNALMSTDEASPLARWLDRNWQHTVESSLRAYPWNFAKKQAKLSADADAPLFRWSYFYTPPPDWLRILPITERGERFGAPVPFEMLENRIATNHSAPLKLTYIKDASANTGAWDSLFVDLVRAKLALGMANRFTGKRQYVAEARDLLSEAMSKAEQVDAFEGTAEPVEQFDIERARTPGLTIIPQR